MKLIISQEGYSPIKISMESLFWNNIKNPNQYKYFKNFIGIKNVVLCGNYSSMLGGGDKYDWFTEKYDSKPGIKTDLEAIFSFKPSKYSLLIDEIEDYINKPVFLPKSDAEKLSKIIKDLNSKHLYPGTHACDINTTELVRIGFINGDKNKPLYYIDDTPANTNKKTPILYRSDTNEIISNMWNDKYEELYDDFDIKKNAVIDSLGSMFLAGFCNPLKINNKLINDSKQNLACIDIGVNFLEDDELPLYKKYYGIQRSAFEQLSDKINTTIRDTLYKNMKDEIISRFNSLIKYSSDIKENVNWFYITNNNECYDSDDMHNDRSLVPFGFNFGFDYINCNNIKMGDFKCYIRVIPVFKNKQYVVKNTYFYVFLEFNSWKLEKLHTDILLKS